MSKESRKLKKILTFRTRRERYCKPKSIIRVRCFMVKRSHGYFARCIDWDLTVIRDTGEEAFNELNNQAVLYYQTVADMGYPKHLLKRRAPLSTIIEYHYHRIKNKINVKTHRNTDGCQIVDLSLNAIAA